MVRQHQVSLRGVVSTVVVTTLVLEVGTLLPLVVPTSLTDRGFRHVLRCHCELVWIFQVAYHCSDVCCA